MEFIFSVLLFIFIFWILRGVITMFSIGWKVRREYKRMKKTAQNFQQRTQDYQARQSTQREKVFDDSDGEFVEFEEIREERVSVPLREEQSANVDWVEDAAFEEIKEK